MDPTQTLELISNYGLGVVSFAALLFFGWKTGTWMQSLTENHLKHLQASLDKLVDGSEKQNEKLDKILEK